MISRDSIFTHTDSYETKIAYIWRIISEMLCRKGPNYSHLLSLEYCAVIRLLSHLKGTAWHHEETFVFTILIVMREMI